MGFIRGSGFVIFSVLFFISLLVMNSLLVISLSLDYDNIKAELVPVVKETLKENINLSSVIEIEKYPMIQQYCENISETGDYVFSSGGYTFVVPCSTLSKGAEAVVDSAIDNFVYEAYYKEYNCSFTACFKQEPIPFFLVSEHSHDYFSGKFYLLLVISLVLAGLMLLFIEKKTNFPIVAGTLIILSSLLFAKLESILLWLVNKLMSAPINVVDSFKFLNLIFVQSHKVFLIMLILGILLVVAGIVLKFFTIGFTINEFFSRFAKKDGEKKSEIRKIDNKQTSKTKKK